jgi:hypothetical protein
MSPTVLKALTSRAVWLAYKSAEPLPIEAMPDGPTLRRLRQAAGVSREILAVVGHTTVDAVSDLETSKTAFSLALNKSTSARRLIAGLIALDKVSA